MAPKNKPAMPAPITPRSSGKKLFEEDVMAGTLRLVAGWINEAQKAEGLPDDDRLTVFYGELLMAAKRIDAHSRKMRAFTDALDCEEDP